MQKDAERLLKEDFKLNSYASKIYIALLKRGMNSKEVSSAAGVPLPRVYDTLRSLSEKGFVERIGGVYEPIRPSIALESRISRLKAAFEEEHEHRGSTKKALVELLQPTYKRRTEKFQDPVLLKGLDSTGNRLLEILTTSKDVIFLVRNRLETAFRKLLDGYKRAWEMCSPTLAAQLFTKNAIYVEDPFDKRPAHGLMEIRRYWEEAAEKQRGVSFTYHNLFSGEDPYVWGAEWTAQYTKTETGETNTLKGVLFCQLTRDGKKIRKFWEYWHLKRGKPAFIWRKTRQELS